MKNETDALNETIIDVQMKREQEKELLLEQWYATYKNLKPGNYLLQKLGEGLASSEIKVFLLGITIGVGAGYFSKMIWRRNSLH